MLNPDALRGSPPHTRGKAAYETAGYSQEGITPAYAGKSGFRIIDQPQY